MAAFTRIYCILKLSELDYHNAHNQGHTRLAKLSELKRQEIEESHKNQQHFIASIKEYSAKNGLEIIYCPDDQLDQIQPTSEDIVLTAGGDGTFLSTAQRFPHCLLLGMNSDYKPKAGTGSHGALTSVNRTNLHKRLSDIQAGKFQIDHWNRLEAKLNDKPLGRFAVNDIYYGQKISYRTCNIVVEQAGQSEEFNCSGILCCTGMGSHAWHYNAGGSPFSNDLDAYGFRVLFPNLKRPLKFTSGILSLRNELMITPERDHYILSFDSGLDVIETEMGDKITISLAKEQAIRILRFNNF